VDAVRCGACAAAPRREFRSIDEEVRELERTRMIEALRASDGHHGRAAALIGMPRRTFATKYKLYELAALDLGRR
jgi:DNA-binding NtrC family response regulator